MYRRTSVSNTGCLLQQANSMISSLIAYHITDGSRGGIVYWPDRDNPYGRKNLDSYGENRSHYLEI